ncbi:MAG: hypothetical protein LQ344_005729 [Seirophora lacunosa]|nr:MAG: hypothetical protein LQ344_005729 [Seirophora lacunosa]
MDHKARTDDKGQAPVYSDSTLPPPASKPTDPPTGPPAPDYNTPRILHIYRDGLTHRHMTITDMDKSHPLYQMDQNSGSAFSSKPHMTISQPSSRPGGGGGGNTPAVVGTATFHTWSRTIDLELHGRPVPFESEGFFTRAYAYASPAFGERLRWECDGVWGADLVLVNARKEWIARFDASLFSMTKTGKIHVVHGGITGAALDEIVVSGCAMMQHERRRRSSSGGAADAAGAAAGGGGGG